MSMRSTSWCGFGFELFQGEDDKIVKFVLENDQYKENLIREIDAEGYDLKDTEDVLEYLLEASDHHSVSGYVADVINYLEGKEIVTGYPAQDDTGAKEMIGIEPLYPWVNKAAGLENLTEAEAEDILQKYMEILGVPGEPDYFVNEYYG